MAWSRKVAGLGLRIDCDMNGGGAVGSGDSGRNVLAGIDRHRKGRPECRRVLKPGGILRLVTPDLEGIARSYLQCLEAAQRGEQGAAARYEWILVELLDQLVRHESGGEMLKLWCRPELPAEDFIAQRVGTEYWRARQHCKGRSISEAAPTDAQAVGRFRLPGKASGGRSDQPEINKLLDQLRKCQVKSSGS